MNRKLALLRGAALLSVLLGIAFACYQVTQPELPFYGIQTVVTANSPGTVTVTHVDAQSPAARAGLRAGDRIFYGNTELDRARILYATPGSHVDVIVDGSRHATLIAPPVQADAGLWIVFTIRLAFLFVAALLAWRRFDDSASRSLVAFLWCFGLTIGMRNNVMPEPQLSLVVQVISTLLLLFGTAAVASFAATFPSGVARPLPKALSRLASVIAIVAAAAAISPSFVATSAVQTAWLNFVILWGMALIAVLVVVILVVAYVQGAPAERQRRRWVFFFLGIGLAAVAVDLALLASVGYTWIVDVATLPFIAAVPFGLAYVILRHRVIDVGFVLNRAVVYAGVSIIIVGIFVVVETLLAKYVETTSHVTSTAVELAVALALGFSIRFVHARVDRFVDTVLFRDRHLAEQAIHDFAHDASYITDTSTLLARCITTVERNAHTRGAGVWVADGTSYRAAASTFRMAPVVDENDPAIVAMRARRVTVHVRDCDSLLPGALAFPMIVRGELVGILVCGPKTDDETFAPDEQAALASLASSVGHALDAIEVRELRRRLEALTATSGSQPAF